MLQVKLGSQKEIFWLAQIHPKSIERAAVKFALKRKLGKQVSFQKVRFQINPVNKTLVKDVQTCVDPVC